VDALKNDVELDELVKYASAVVSEISGNILGEKQAFMVESRLRKRMTELGYKNPSEYLNHIKRHASVEHDYLVSSLTTHHTFFFREFRHFEYLLTKLPEIVDRLRSQGKTELEILCLACSRGQESYSLAMFLDYHLKQIAPSFTFKISGTDIDKESVKIANNGVYRYQEISSAPMKYISGHWQKGTGEISHFAKVKQSLRKNCNFKEGNILKIKKEHISKNYDVVFCRNVFIYFELEQIEKISNDILSVLKPGGLFFTGISESLNNYKINDLSSLGPSIYTHKSYVDAAKAEKKPLVGETGSGVTITPIKAKVPAVKARAELPAKLKVLCVDDSKTVLTILKKVFGERDDFELVGTCENGIEVEEFLKNNEVDVMTLDIHMPKMDGVTYLGKNFKKGHPAVVMVSSASRDDATHALKALKNGASDFVEKPALNDIKEKGDEICTKLKVAYLDGVMGDFAISSYDKQISHVVNIEDPESCAYIVYSNFADKRKLVALIKDIEKQVSQPPTFILLEGNYDLLPGLMEQIREELHHVKVEDLSKADNFESDCVYMGDFSHWCGKISQQYKSDKQVSMIIGHVSNKARETLINLDSKFLLVEDLGKSTDEIKDVAKDCVPVTSFGYLCHSYFLKED